MPPFISYRVETPYLTQVKVMGACTVPRVDVQAAVTYLTRLGGTASAWFFTGK